MAKFSGILRPSDLDVLQRVFDHFCEERRLTLKDRDQREQLAREVIYDFQNGITDEAALLHSLSKRYAARRQA